jgi:Effector-associated domain 7
MLILLIIKFVVVAIFLVMFWRRPSVNWGVGLLTVLSALLLDTILGTFNRDELLAQLGFFYYVIVGFLGGGAAYWLFTLFQPFQIVQQENNRTTAVTLPSTNVVQFSPGSDKSGTTFDRQLIYEEIRDRLGREDVLDLLFDLNIQDNEVMSLQQEMEQLIINIMNLTAERGQTGQLALAVERILTPPAPETLPRLEKISLDSPPTILRHYLLAYYDLEKLQKTAVSLSIDWEQLSVNSKKSKVRDLLHYLYRRNRIDELIGIMQTNGTLS